MPERAPGTLERPGFAMDTAIRAQEGVTLPADAPPSQIDVGIRLAERIEALLQAYATVYAADLTFVEQRVLVPRWLVELAGPPLPGDERR